MSMGQDDGKGSFSANIPKSVLDEALEAVERNEEAGEEGGAAAEPGARRESSELESLRTQLEMSQAAGREGFEKLKEEHDRFLRAVADLENYRKRAQREKEEIQKFGIERLLKDLFPVVDNLDRALAAAPEGDALAGGVKLVLKTLEDALARHGVKSFHALGEAFDPRRHEAIMTVVAPETFQLSTAESPWSIMAWSALKETITGRRTGGGGGGWLGTMVTWLAASADRAPLLSWTLK
jgi:molecular chaperone GrpE